MSLYQYALSGIRINSQIKLSLQEVNSSSSDYTILPADEHTFSFDKIPEAISGRWVSRRCKDGTIFRYKDIYIKVYKNVIAYHEERPCEHTVSSIIETSVLRWLLVRKSFILFHGTSFQLSQNESGLVLGDSFEGKSTFAASMLASGVSVFSDETAIIEPNSDDSITVFNVRPSLPYIKLREDVVNLFDSLPLGAAKRTLEGKYIIPIPNHNSLKPIKLRKIFFLEESESSKVSIIQTGKHQHTFEKLNKNSQEHSIFLKNFGPMHNFTMLTQIMRQCDIFVLSRPKTLEANRIAINKILEM